MARDRLTLTLSPERWWSAAVERMRLQVAPMSADVLLAAAGLPGAAPDDAADRILVATAREYGLRLMTRDPRLLAYAEAGRLDAVAC